VFVFNTRIYKQPRERERERERDTVVKEDSRILDVPV